VQWRKTNLVLILICGASLLGAAGLLHAAPPSPTDLDWLRSECDDGALAYAHGGKVFLTELATGKTARIGRGKGPEFSPDSTRLAWIDGDAVVVRLRDPGDKDEPTRIKVDKLDAGGGAHWIDDKTLVARLRDAKWVRLAADGRGEPEPVEALNRIALRGPEPDVKLADDGVWSIVAGEKWRTSDGKRGEVPGNCSVSLSPDGRSATSLAHNHTTAHLTAIRDGGHAGKMHWKYDRKKPKGFDNHRWSSNDPRFVVCQDEKHNYMIVMHVRTGRCTRMGESGGGEMYGDFTVTPDKPHPAP
jgi:hypothetical protein